MQGDLSAGDGLLTIDMDTGLEWLDLTETWGASYNEAQASTYVTSMGFDHATEAQVAELFTNAGFVTTTNHTQNDAAAALLLGLMGCTQSCNTNFDQGTGFAVSSVVNGVTTIGRSNYHEGPLGGGVGVYSLRTTNLDSKFASAGNFLVRSTQSVQPVPEPSTFLGLATFGGVAYFFRRERRPGQPAS